MAERPDVQEYPRAPASRCPYCRQALTLVCGDDDVRWTCACYRIRVRAPAPFAWVGDYASAIAAFMDEFFPEVRWRLTTATDQATTTVTWRARQRRPQ